ncbi:Gallate 1-beta-glucosyltransferase [Sesamum angolense]|uniref:Gallate 1-beta-glucosyltransferase n=1 Tax=Sesamum angolense TaxID=2727404 RepID=A0AAE1WYP9_9LAMI|nr:Gallate 1-beta-glucosyltransferase [Sesamum angolense]
MLSYVQGIWGMGSESESMGFSRRPAAYLGIYPRRRKNLYLIDQFHFCEQEPEIDVLLPHVPLLKHDEIPSFLHPSPPYPLLRRAILDQFKNLSNPFCILMDTFQELEHQVIEHMSKVSCPIKTIGPLLKELKSPNTVEARTSDEIAHGILGSEVSFLWVVRPPPKELNVEPHVLPQGFLEKAGNKGKIVKWSPQEQVLAHPSTACFVYGGLARGVPVVAFAQWSDQVTDAKFLVDVFKVGTRLCTGDAEGRFVPRDEVERCFRAAIGCPEAAEMKQNSLKWKKAAEEAWWRVVHLIGT